MTDDQAGQVLWRPSRERAEGTRLARFAAQVQARHGVVVTPDEQGYAALHRWSVEHLEDFWALVWEHFDVQCSAPPERVAEAVANEWFCSFAGNVTYPKAGALREAARLVPDDLILVETDAPFLAPQSRRGKPNEPALVVETAREVAAARGVAPEALDALVEENAARVFAW